MKVDARTLEVQRLGACTVASGISGMSFVEDGDRVALQSDPMQLRRELEGSGEISALEKAGPRARIYFDPPKLKCGIITCGGLCPGINDVIRAIVLSLYHNYGVRSVLGFPCGFEGLTDRYGHTPMKLDPEAVSRINDHGGTILGSSRGRQNVEEMVDTLDRMNIGLLFVIGGDGALRGAQAMAEEIRRRGLKIGVIGIPKTIDNDICFVERSFGYVTAVAEAVKAIDAAHTEAKGARNGISLVKLMGRESGFIAMFASLASSDVNFCLIPEAPFRLEKLLPLLRSRLEKRRHAVIVAAEGAGQDLIGALPERDASGRLRLKDIGVFLRERILEYFTGVGMDATFKYIDPSYTIRSVPANAYDSAFCLILGQNAVHAGMAGRTNMVVGYWMRSFTHVPIPLAVSERRRVDPHGWAWGSLLTSTGQPRDMQ